MKAAKAIACASLCAALAGGCGDESPRYRLGATLSCLEAAGVSATYHLDETDYFVFDPIARDASGGALHATFGLTSVVVVFERSAGDAERTETEYNAIFGKLNNPKVLQRRRNAVVVWLRGRPDDAAAQVDECLTS